MNFITSDAAYSLYPRATFEERSALGTPASRHAATALQKYVQRGWRIYFLPPPDVIANPAQSPFMLDQVRWVCDKHTWVVPLDQTGVKKRPPSSRTSAPLPCDPALFNGWRFTSDKTNGFDCHYYPVQSTVFRYNYAIPDEKLQLMIRGWVTQQGRYSHEQFSKEDWVWYVFFCVSLSLSLCGMLT